MEKKKKKKKRKARIKVQILPAAHVRPPPCPKRRLNPAASRALVPASHPPPLSPFAPPLRPGVDLSRGKTVETGPFWLRQPQGRPFLVRISSFHSPRLPHSGPCIPPAPSTLLHAPSTARCGPLERKNGPPRGLFNDLMLRMSIHPFSQYPRHLTHVSPPPRRSLPPFRPLHYLAFPSAVKR